MVLLLVTSFRLHMADFVGEVKEESIIKTKGESNSSSSSSLVFDFRRIEDLLRDN